MKKVTYITLKVLAMPDPFSPGEGLTISKDVEHFPAFDRQLSSTAWATDSILQQPETNL